MRTIISSQEKRGDEYRIQLPPALKREETQQLLPLIEKGREAAKALELGQLSVEKEEDLQAQIEAGNCAEQTLIQGNLRFVMLEAGKLSRRAVCLTVNDLFQIGYFGLVRALDNYSSSYGSGFIIYARPYIRGEMLRQLNLQDGLVNIPAHVGEEVARLASDQDEGISENPWVSSQLVADAQVFQKEPFLSLDFIGETGLRLDERISDPHSQDKFEELEERLVLETLMREAGTIYTEARALKMYYGLGGGEPKTFREIGEELGVSPQRIKQICKRGLARLVREAKRQAA